MTVNRGHHRRRLASRAARAPGRKTYMASPEWKAKRKEKLQEVGQRCQGCSSDERLEVHHLTYERLGHERLEDLMVLCHTCHAAEHGHTPDAGPVAGLTAEDHVRRGIGPELLRSQRDALQAAVLEKMATETEAFARTMENPRARKKVLLAVRCLRGAARHLAPTEDEASVVSLDPASAPPDPRAARCPVHGMHFLESGRCAAPRCQWSLQVLYSEEHRDLRSPPVVR